MGTPSLAVIVPTRGRPQAVAQLVGAWEDTGATAALVLGVDEDDPALPDYRAAVLAFDDGKHDIDLVVGPRLRMIGTLNAIAVDYAGRFDAIGFIGDDHRPRTERWDQRFLDVLADRPRIVYGDDGYQGEACPTACFMTSDIVKTLGYFAPPAFIHLEADRVWLEWGQVTGRIVYRPDVSIEHMHPVADKAGWDAGYAAVNSDEMYSTDQAANQRYHADGGFRQDVEKIRALIS